MATKFTTIYQRGNTAQGFVSIDKLLGCGFDKCETYLTSSIPAAAAAIPSLGAVQEYTSADRIGETVVCSGTGKLIGDTWGILTADGKASETGNYMTKAPKILMPVTAGAGNAIAIGLDVYVITATGFVTFAKGAGKVWVGKCLSENNSNVGEGTAPNGLPTNAAGWVYVDFRQEPVS